MKVEMFYTPSCAACLTTHQKLQTAARQLVHDLEWRELNVVDNIDRAVELGVLTVPSIAIDGEIVFTSMPTPRQLRGELTKRATKKKWAWTSMRFVKRWSTRACSRSASPS